MIEEIGLYRNRMIVDDEGVADALLTAQRPAAGPLAATPLPTPPTPLVGREQELSALEELLADPAARVITLSGPGGAGKTRLAIQSAAANASLFEGIAFVDLSAFREADAVLPAIVRHLGMSDSGDSPLLERIAGAIDGRRFLLVLDNFERLIAAAPLIPELVARCPSLTLLVTSREVLRIYGEHELAVPPLGLPDGDPCELERLGESDAVRLFVDRARSVRLGFQIDSSNAATVAAICARLDGLPLAIELAAARMRHLSPQALLSRLTSTLSVLTQGSRDLPTRLQTMRNAISWSHELLTPADQALFRRLAVFRGGFNIDAAEWIMWHESPERERAPAAWEHGPRLEEQFPISADVLDGISSLVDKSLLIAVSNGEDDARYSMLETLREFGLEQLAAHGETEAARRGLALWCVNLAERAAADYTGPNRAAHARRLDRERANIGEVLCWAEAAGEADLALRLAAAVAPYWEVQGNLREGEEWSRRCLAIPGAEESAAYGHALCGGAGIAYRRGSYAEATTLALDARSVGERSGDRSLVAASLLILGNVAFDRGELQACLDYYRAATAEYRKLRNWDGIADARAKEGLVLVNLDELDDATAALDEALLIGRRLNRPIWVATAIGRLAFVEQRRGNLAVAEQRISEILPAHRELSPISAVAMLWLAATIARDAGNLHLAAERFRESLDLRSRWGERRGVAEAVSGIAELAVLTGHVEEGVRLYGGLDSMRYMVGAPGYRSEQACRDQALATARLTLGEAVFARIHAEGRAMPRGETVALAREIAERIVAGSPAAQPEPTPVGSGAEYERLTARELEVLRFAALGLSDRAIGDALYISPRTVARHLHSVYQKFAVSSRAAATAFAHRNGILTLTDI